MINSLAGGIASVLDIVFKLVQLVIIASVIISWVGGSQSNQIVQIVNSLAEPMFRPFRKLTKYIPGPIDWAPFVLFLLIIFLQQTVVGYLFSIAHSGSPF